MPENLLIKFGVVLASEIVTSSLSLVHYKTFTSGSVGFINIYICVQLICWLLYVMDFYKSELLCTCLQVLLSNFNVIFKLNKSSRHRHIIVDKKRQLFFILLTTSQIWKVTKINHIWHVLDGWKFLCFFFT